MNARVRGTARVILPALALLLVGLSLPYWAIQTNFVLSVVIIAVIWAIAGQGWNISGGYGGLLSFGHSTFFGIGAYTTAILTVRTGLSPWIGLVAGAALAAAAGAILTFPALRLRGVYFTLATFVLSLLLTDLAVTNVSVTGGDQGILLPFSAGGDPSKFEFSSKVTLYFVFVAFLALATLIVSLVSRSKLGLFLRASRDDPDAARAAGVNVTRVRLVGLVISAAVTSVAGSLMLEYIRSITPATAFGATSAFTISMVALVGGRGTVFGPIVGAAVIIPVQQLLSARFVASGPPGLSGIVYAAIVIAIMLMDSRGILSLLERLFRWVGRRVQRGSGGPVRSDHQLSAEHETPAPVGQGGRP